MNSPNIENADQWNDSELFEQDEQDEILEEDQNQETGTFSISYLISSTKFVLYDVSSHWGKKFYHSVICPQNPQAEYKRQLELAENYEQWAAAATELDRLQGKDAWKLNPASDDYDYDLLQARLIQLQRVRKSGDVSYLIFLLRTSLARNLGDMGLPKLYAYTNIGTKKLIEVYIQEVVKDLNYICDAPSEEITTKSKLEFFTNIRQSLGRTALLLSGGATFGLTHLGVIKSLNECDLLPRIVSGASSGSIIAALVCTKTDAEIPHFLAHASSVNLEVFEKSSDPDTWLRRLIRLLKQGVLFDVDILRECMRENIGDMTFQEAYNRTRRILNITVSSSGVYEMPRLLNYLTAPNVTYFVNLIYNKIGSVDASLLKVDLVGSVRFISAPLMAKDKLGKVVPWNPEGARWIDGSVENDLPMNKLSELFNVNHFIVCQVNPHVIPFLQTSLIPSFINRFVSWLLFLAISELQHRLTQLSELGIATSLIYRLQSMMSQRYYGDITIVPHISYANFLNLLSNPSPQLVEEATLRGERATWPKISIIRNHCHIELTLDEMIYRLRLIQLNDSLATRNSGDDHDLETHPGNLSDSSSAGGKCGRREQRTKKIVPQSLSISKLEVSLLLKKLFLFSNESIFSQMNTEVSTVPPVMQAPNESILPNVEASNASPIQDPSDGSFTVTNVEDSNISLERDSSSESHTERTESIESQINDNNDNIKKAKETSEPKSNPYLTHTYNSTTVKMRVWTSRRVNFNHTNSDANKILGVGKLKENTLTKTRNKNARNTYPAQKTRTINNDPKTKKNLDSQKNKFYGNYAGYYRRRSNTAVKDDPRLEVFDKSFFERKEVLDIGCNSGEFTIEIATRFSPKRILGIDIDEKLIEKARSNVHKKDNNEIAGSNDKFENEINDESENLSGRSNTAEIVGSDNDITNKAENDKIEKNNEYHSIHSESLASSSEKIPMPYERSFRKRNFPAEEKYDTILALSITKWIHLNHGDSGMKKFFRKIYDSLKPGGIFIIEPQPWSSYRKYQHVSETHRRNYNNARFLPTDFHRYLMKEVGYTSCRFLNEEEELKKGFRRNIIVYTKRNTP
ncbi:12984_t:CDS:10 [Ambispora leptoticha]|uniref:12984_t:CDS:1 n=1 Tax=Ambispora leptoticha TaxID=144679 RepID=A0A9N8Z146_9GLOM|nr:12984_t:CDS:10 [Ambispora leptoticha]